MKNLFGKFEYQRGFHNTFAFEYHSEDPKPMMVCCYCNPLMNLGVWTDLLSRIELLHDQDILIAVLLEEGLSLGSFYSGYRSHADCYP